MSFAARIDQTGANDDVEVSATGSASAANKGVLGRRDVARRRMVVMERANDPVLIRSGSLSQGYVLTEHGPPHLPNQIFGTHAVSSQ
jgi:hypothetical protein